MACLCHTGLLLSNFSRNHILWSIFSATGEVIKFTQCQQNNPEQYMFVNYIYIEKNDKPIHISYEVCCTLYIPTVGAVKSMPLLITLFTDCPSNRWGPGCNNLCNCLEHCDGVTGNCTAGCVPGKIGTTCQEGESGNKTGCKAIWYDAVYICCW